MSGAMVGSVLQDGQAFIFLRVRGSNGEIANLQTVIDTGFNDFLTLPLWVIERLDLQVVEDIRFKLGDGTWAQTRRYAAEVEWLGNWRRTFVAEMENDPLIGTEMMKGCLLTIEMLDGGRVEIRPLAPAH